jgi:hypothetical protein
MKKSWKVGRGRSKKKEERRRKGSWKARRQGGKEARGKK